MIFFGHLGIGTELVTQAKKRKWIKADLSLKWVLLGTVLPDLVDKPLYYALSYFTGLHGSEIGLISGTRTFGHCIPIALILWSITNRFNPRVVTSIFLGMLSHQFLDLMLSANSVYVFGRKDNYLWEGFLFPLLGIQFPIHPFESTLEHARQLSMRFDIYIWEPIGLMFLILGFKKNRWTAPARSSF